MSTLAILGSSPVGASSANISRSYHSSDNITNGNLVSLDSQHSDHVELANTKNGARLLGVTVASTDSLIAVNPSNTTIQVATSGTASALVGTLNGDISVGDKVSVSPIDGVGIKAPPGSYVIGLAQTAFNSSSEGAVQRQITSKSGKKANIAIGYIRLSVAIGTDNTSGGQAPLNALQRIAQSLTNHTVSTARVIVSLIVATVAIIALVALIYASVYGTIISIGRNPLAKYAILRTLGSVLAMAVLTAVTASLTIFFLLH